MANALGKDKNMTESVVRLGICMHGGVSHKSPNNKKIRSVFKVCAHCERYEATLRISEHAKDSTDHIYP